MIFSGGACHDKACSLERWRAFLRGHDQSELPATGTLVRYFEFAAEEEAVLDSCSLHITRVDLAGETGGTSLSACTLRAKRTLTADQARRLKSVLAEPALAALDGPFPAYCPEGVPQAEKTNLLEILQEGRYRLIEWDCEAPPAVIPLLALLNPTP